MQNSLKVLVGVFAFFLAGLTFSEQAAAHAPLDGGITGQVVDAGDGSPLLGANVVIEGTTRGTATDAQGRFSLAGVPAGEHTLVVSYVGYETVERQVDVPDGSTVDMTVELSWKGVQGEEVTISVQAEGQTEAINQQLQSNTISNVVSEARIRELPDVNAAESIGRLPGVSIQRSGGEATKVAIRGLSPKYNNVTVNGVKLPSTDANNRSVDLSLISSNALNGIEVKKAVTPDMDADAIGGSVDLRLKKAANEPTVNLSAQGGYNRLQDDYGNYKFTGSVSNRFFDDRFGAILNFNTDNFNRSANKLSGGYRATNNATAIEISNLELRDEDITRSRLGGSVLLDYRLSNGSVTANSFYQRQGNEGTIRTSNYTLAGNQAINWNLQAQESSTYLFTGALSIEQDFDWIRYDATVSRSASDTESPENRSWGFIQEGNVQNPDTSQITPDVPIEKAQLFAQELVSTNASLATIMVDEVERDENTMTTELNLQAPFRLSDNISGYVKTGGKLRWLDRSNDIRQVGRGGLQYGSTSDYLNEPLECINNNLPDMDLSQMVGALGIPYSALLDSTYSKPDFLDDYNFAYAPNPDVLNQFTDALQQCSEEPNNHYREQPIGSYGDDYSGIERYQAGYVMAEFSLGPYVTLLPGVRWERDFSRYNGQRYREVFSGYEPLPPQGYDSLETERENAFWLPMVHLRVEPTDWLTLRLARTETISRPDYRQYAPITTIDQYSSTVNAANSALRPSHATNYDASLSIYNGTAGLLTLSAFHKTIEEQIISASYLVSSTFTDELEGTNIPPSWYQGATPTVYTNINNPFDATLQGIEAEWQTNFWYLPSFLSGLVLSANYSYIHSETTYQNFLTVAGDSLIVPRPPTYNQVLTDTTRTGRIPDQPSHIANIMLGYDYGGFSTRLSFLYQTDVTTYVSARNPLEDTFSADYFRVDLTLRQKLIEGLEVFANLNNLTGEPDLNYRGGDIGRLTYEENYGFTLDIGGRYSF